MTGRPASVFSGWRLRSGPLGQMIRAAAPALKAASSEAARSAVVNISSRAALMGSGSSVPYACSKAAVNALTMSMAHS